jgi:hypothetical protein
MLQSDSVLWFYVCWSTGGQLRLQDHVQKLYKVESVKNSSTEGDFPGLGTDYPGSNEQKADKKALAVLNSNTNNSAVDDFGSENQEGKGPNGDKVTATTLKEGDSVKFEQIEDTLDNGQADEIIFASKEQSPLLARYMQKVRAL